MSTSAIASPREENSSRALRELSAPAFPASAQYPHLNPYIAHPLVSRPIHARIDLSALRHNYLQARRRASGTRAFAVVKADAYGHGLLRAARALGDVADGFALLDLAEGVALRDAGIRQPIVLLEGLFAASDVAVCVDYDLRPAIHCFDQIAMLRSVPAGARLSVGLKINSGMNRLGFTPDQVPHALAELQALPGVAAVMLMSHFANADDPRGVDWQYQRMAALLADYPGEVSLANSAAILRHTQVRCDWVRPGIVLYGGSPFAGERAASFGLRPVMTLQSRLIGVQEVLPGDRVGYGGLFEATQATRIGVVACGYADGYPRHVPGGSPILVNGQRTVTVGRVSMDMMACDLSAIPDAGIGSEVTLWGEGLPADEVAAAAGTISYELFCSLARRVPVSECGLEALAAEIAGAVPAAGGA
ncbi:alanine racemase [Rhodocyclus tenuis]|uniref:alanine racemase n=1 Tax=Rhodocyclus gracilis TaxID=2929842 RepID=UPI001298D059|nr:alanine racemase [Rhodocyclus gracilis]MRD73810.1 alanine racemase [Rhodocyclus gracilis]